MNYRIKQRRFPHYIVGRNCKRRTFDVIEVENLTKKYGNHVAGDNLSFRVERGMIYGFLGPNGAGKSTTMNMITGYIEQTEGNIIVDGFDTIKKSKKAKIPLAFWKNVCYY